MHNKWLHTWFLGVCSIVLIAPVAGFLAWAITRTWEWFWMLFGFYVVMGIVCIIIDTINHLRGHRGLFEHSNGCYSLKLLKKKEKQ
ncbi:MAG: hypothetical protein EU536_00235 [Promethearchaeota archaeon]|nr:MAG: hypothetical protein EU536_00235 [Candidatus Lokiarchaeota archaeon]